MNRLENFSNVYMDRVASHLRSQTVLMRDVLETLERSSSNENEYVLEAIKSVEVELRRIRKFLDSD